jgi:hypothetical protein
MNFKTGFKVGQIGGGFHKFWQSFEIFLWAGGCCHPVVASGKGKVFRELKREKRRR